MQKRFISGCAINHKINGIAKWISAVIIVAECNMFRHISASYYAKNILSLFNRGIRMNIFCRNVVKNVEHVVSCPL